MTEIQKITLLQVLAAEPGKPILLVIKTAEFSSYGSVTPLEAMTMAEALVRNVRIAMFGTKGKPVSLLSENPGSTDATKWAMTGDSLDMTSDLLSQMVRLLPTLSASASPSESNGLVT